MKKKLVGQVTSEECSEIQILFGRKNGLKELGKILNSDNVELYEKLLNDIDKTDTKFHNWWKTMARKYKWESEEGSKWEINFETGDIYLVTT